MNDNFKNTLNNDTTEWRARLAYKCGICNKEYDSIKDRAACELECLKRQEKEKRIAAEKKKKEEQSARKAEVDKAVAHAQELINQYAADYGHYACTLSDILDDPYLAVRKILGNMLP